MLSARSTFPAEPSQEVATEKGGRVNSYEDKYPNRGGSTRNPTDQNDLCNKNNYKPSTRCFGLTDPV